MMALRRSTGVIFGGIATASVLAVLLLAQTSGSSVLVVTDTASGEDLVVTDVEDGTPVVLSYRHSVEKTMVRDVYVVDDGTLRMTRMEFSSFGWGLPARESIDGRTDDGAFVVRYENRTYEEIFVAPGTVANHTLLVGETSYDLVERSNGTTVRLSVTRQRPLHRSLSHT